MTYLFTDARDAEPSGGCCRSARPRLVYSSGSSSVATEFATAGPPAIGYDATRRCRLSTLVTGTILPAESRNAFNTTTQQVNLKWIVIATLRIDTTGSTGARSSGTTVPTASKAATTFRQRCRYYAPRTVPTTATAAAAATGNSTA